MDLSIPCIGTAADLAAQDAADEISSAIETAGNLMVPYVAVHTVCADTRAVTERLTPLVALAENHKVVLLLESGGALADTRKLVEVLDYFACDHLAACWDAHHTCLMQKETPEETITNLGAYVRYVRLTDGADPGILYSFGPGRKGFQTETI